MIGPGWRIYSFLSSAVPLWFSRSFLDDGTSSAFLDVTAAGILPAGVPSASSFEKGDCSLSLPLLEDPPARRSTRANDSCRWEKGDSALLLEGGRIEVSLGNSNTRRMLSSASDSTTSFRVARRTTLDSDPPPRARDWAKERSAVLRMFSMKAGSRFGKEEGGVDPSSENSNAWRNRPSSPISTMNFLLDGGRSVRSVSVAGCFADVDRSDFEFVATVFLVLLLLERDRSTERPRLWLRPLLQLRPRRPMSLLLREDFR